MVLHAATISQGSMLAAGGSPRSAPTVAKAANTIDMRATSGSGLCWRTGGLVIAFMERWWGIWGSQRLCRRATLSELLTTQAMDTRSSE